MTTPDSSAHQAFLLSTGVPADPSGGAVGRAGRRRTPVKENVRFTLDLDRKQHMELRMFGLQHGIEAAKVCRALLKRLSTDPVLANQVLDDLFGVDDDEDPDGS